MAAPASASSVAYIDDHNLWFSSPDGARKVQVTTGGNNDASWMFPSQGRDGKTVVVHRDAFEGGSKRPVLYLYGPDGKLVTANVMPRLRRRRRAPVYPIGLDMDWNSNAVAYGYQYCGFACWSLYRGFWLTFSDNQGAFPSDPQGQSDAFNPTFYKTRVVFRGLRRQHLRAARRRRGAVHEPPTRAGSRTATATSSAAPRSRPPTTRSRSTGSEDDGATGITVAQHSGTVPSDLVAACDIPAAGKASYATFSPDGSQMAWTDDEGLKVAGVPNLAAGTDTCTLTAPAHVISATGRMPSFGGADVNAVAGVGGAAGGASRGRRHAKPGATPKAITRPPLRQGHARRVRQGPHAQGRRGEGRAHRRLRRDRQEGRRASCA